MRIQCFHYLGQEERSTDTSEGSEGGGAAQLAQALLSFHEQVHNVLAPHRLAVRIYIYRVDMIIRH